MKEEYLHHVFKSKILGNSFKTTLGLDLKVLDFGLLNSNAGPDFLGTRISLESTTWAGSIEFHVKSSDWFLHGHQFDDSYKNVIAHFVYEHDRDVEIGGSKIPTVELKDNVDLNHYKKFLSVSNSKSTIPCSENIKTVDKFVVFQQMERALFNRLVRKSEIILADLQQFNGDLEKTFYIALARTFGGKVNAEAFATLTEKLDMRILHKLHTEPNAIPALIFGSANLLPDVSKHKYVLDLKREFEFQKVRLAIDQMNKEEFRFSRMLPHGFPTIRLAQLSEILKRGLPLTQMIAGRLNLAELKDLFKIDLPEFWNTHYRFENETKTKSTSLSDAFIELILINAVIPFLFALGLKNGDTELKEKAVNYLSDIKPETNSVIMLWRRMGVEIKSAFETQALIEQKNEYCSKKKCLFCAIGIQLLKP